MTAPNSIILSCGFSLIAVHIKWSPSFDVDVIMDLFSQPHVIFCVQSSDWCSSKRWGVWVVYLSVAVMTWRVTLLIHPAAAFWLKLGHQLCGVMHDGSDAAVWLAANH